MFKPVIIDPKTATIYHLVKPRSDATLCRMSALTYSSRHGRVQGNVIFSTGSLPLCRICQKVLTRIENEKLGKKRLKEHLVQPYEEAEFYPVMLYRGATPLGRVKAIYNYFTAAMEMELSTIGELVTYASNHGWNSDLAHLSGIHANQTDRRVFYKHGTRFLAHPEVTARTPHLHQYLEFLREEGGLKLIPLRPVTRWTSLPTRRLWRYRKSAPVSPVLIPDLYPYLPEGITLSDDEELLVTVEQMVPKNIPEQIRGDLCQDLIVGILSGEIKAENLANEISRYVKSTFKRYPMKYCTLSLDLPLTESGFTLNDILGGSYVDVGMCHRCEEITEELDGGLCAKCYEAVEKEIRARAVTQHVQTATLFHQSKSRPRLDMGFVASQEISLEQWREQNDDRAVLSFPEDDGNPDFLFDRPEHDGHDSNRRTDAWKEDPLPYIYDGKNHNVGSLMGKRRWERQQREHYHAAVEQTKQEIKRKL